MEACSLLVNLRKGMQSSSEQPLVGAERYVTILTTAAKETTSPKLTILIDQPTRGLSLQTPSLSRFQCTNDHAVEVPRY